MQTLARYTGLSETFVRRSGLRISMQAFAKELLRDQSYTVGRFDGRYLGRDRLDAGDSPDYDPSYAVVQGAYSAALNDYVRRELNYASDIDVMFVGEAEHRAMVRTARSVLDHAGRCRVRGGRGSRPLHDVLLRGAYPGLREAAAGALECRLGDDTELYCGRNAAQQHRRCNRNWRGFHFGALAVDGSGRRRCAGRSSVVSGALSRRRDHRERVAVE